MALEKISMKLLNPFHVRSVSSFISKKTQQKIDQRKIKENRRLQKLSPDHDKDLPTNTYAATNRNPVSRVYSWGMACYGALGRPDLVIQKKNYKNPLTSVKYPMRVAAMEMKSVKDVACGYGFSLFAVNDSKGHIYGTGLNNQGQIGYHAEVEDHPLQVLLKPVPTKLPNKGTTSKVKRIECGQAHTIALTSEGQVFSLGNNAFGQCGRPVIENEDYFRSQVIHSVQLPLDENDTIIDIECGVNHTLFLSQNGKVYSCGWSADGQTGLGHYNNQHSPERVLGDISCEKIIKVTCSADNVLALNDKGEVFGWGNSEYSQFKMVTEEQQINKSVKLDMGPVGKVIDIASGGSMCMVLNDQHDVWVWGYGILGQGPNVQHSEKPLLLPPTLFGRNEINHDAKTEKIFCGIHNCAAINSYGDLYTWGLNKGSCLGLGDHKNDQFFPFKVNLGGEAKKVSLGIDHTIALCKPYV